jgi:hypothetical protein
MSRLERLNQAMKRLLDDSASEGEDYLLATMYCSLILKDVEVGEIPPLSGDLAVFTDLMRDRDRMLANGDAEGVCLLKADVRAALRESFQRLLETVGKDAAHNR